MAKEIIITLDKETRTAEIELEGFQGVGCSAVMDGFEKLGDMQNRGKKPEYNQKGRQTVNQ